MKFNVLIVEDDLTMRMIIRQTLVESNLDIGKIYEAENGKIGLEMVDKYSINLLLVDIYMPVMDGMEMLEHIENQSDLKNIPTVVISTERNEKRIDAIVRKGLGFVHKPFTKDLLEDQIKMMTVNKNEQSLR